MENADIAKIFYEIADLLEIKGENPFRVRSYRNAGIVIEGLPESVKAIVERNEKELEEIPGIGKSIHEKIVEILKTGRCSYHQELLKEFPSGLLELLRVQGVGPKKVKLLYEELGIKNISDLEKAASAGKLRGLPGMGEKTEANILKAIKGLKGSEGRFKIAVALSYAEPLVEYLKKAPDVFDVQPAGSLRRWKDTIGDIDILVTCKKSAPVMDRFAAYPDVDTVVAKGETKSTVILKNGLQADVRVLDKKAFGAALQYFTGSKQHNIAIRDRAKRMGLKLSEYGVFREKDDKWIAGESEEDVYKAVGLPWIPAELRENRGEIEAAEKNKLPELVEIKDIKGDFHIHTKESDGSNTIEEMAEYAMKKGYKYIAITEHSKAVGIAHGLDEKRLLKQIEEIEKINAKFEALNLKFKILKGTEVDIKADGSLDLDKKVLEKLDIVVGAVHSRFNMTEDEMTNRLIKAIESGIVNIIAHPTGRLIAAREPYPLNMKKVMEAAKRNNVIMELNAYPDRLDLNDIHCKLAKDIGVMVAISTDSHNKMQMENIRFGVYTARRGWLEKEDILNTRPLNDVLKMLKLQGQV